MGIDGCPHRTLAPSSGNLTALTTVVAAASGPWPNTSRNTAWLDMLLVDNTNWRT